MKEDKMMNLKKTIRKNKLNKKNQTITDKKIQIIKEMIMIITIMFKIINN